MTNSPTTVGANGAERGGSHEAVERSHEAEAGKRVAVDGSDKAVLETTRTAADNTRFKDPREVVTAKAEAVACGDETVDEDSRQGIASSCHEGEESKSVY